MLGYKFKFANEEIRRPLHQMPPLPRAHYAIPETHLPSCRLLEKVLDRASWTSDLPLQIQLPRDLQVRDVAERARTHLPETELMESTIPK